MLGLWSSLVPYRQLIQIAGLFVFLFAFSSCNHLLYPADRRMLIKKESLRQQPKDLFIPLTTGPESPLIHAWYFESLTQENKGTVVHFHGNGENLTTHFLFFQWMVSEGYNYLIFDYRGYGESSDPKASQKKTVEDGLAVMKYVFDSLKPKKTIVIGQSLGSNVLLRVLQETNKKQLPLPQIAIFESSFMSYQAAARSVLSQRWFLYPLKPFTYLVIDDDDSAKKLTDCNPPIPALFYHGTKDPVIRYELGQEAFDRWKGPKQFIPQTEGGHTSAFGDRRFVQANRQSLLKCLDTVLNSKKDSTIDLQNCVK